MTSLIKKYSSYFHESMKLHHLGYACADINSGLIFIKSKYKIKQVGQSIYDPIQNASLCFLSAVDSPDIELVAGHPVKQLIKNGTCLYHLCYEVDNLERALHELKEKGGTQVSKICPAKLFDNRNVVFIQTKIGLVELLESKSASFLENSKQTVILSGTFTTENIKEDLATLCDKYKFPYQIKSQGYESLHFELVNEHSELNNNKINILLVREQDFEKSGSLDITNIKTFIENLKYSALRSSANYIVMLCPSKNINTSGTSSNQLNIENALKGQDNITFVNLEKLINPSALVHIYNEFTDKEAKIPYQEHFNKILSGQLLKKLYGLYHNQYKVIVVDCDNTLWSGVCGEDSIEEIKLTEANLVLQKKLISMRQKGFLICLCSKNSEKDARKIFAECTNMLLGEADVTAWYVNWREKSDNLINLSQALNLPLSSFVFIDDNSIECKQIETLLPDVLTLQFTDDHRKLNHILENLLAFDKPSPSTLPQKRVGWYSSHLNREKQKSNSKNLKEFLDSLELKIEINRADLEDCERISELSYRVTQFNCSNKTYTKKEVQKLFSENARILKVNLKDKFGDYGLVGVIIALTLPKNLLVDTFLLSCRALSRGVEHEMLKYLASTARELGIHQIEILFKSTDRNTPAQNFISSLTVDSKESTPNTTSYTIKCDDAANVSFHPDKPLKADLVPDLGGTNTSVWRLSTQEIMELLELTITSAANTKPFSTTVKIRGHENISAALEKIWKKVLGKSKIKESTNFFEMGGTSLLALRLASDIREFFEIDIKLYEIFEFPNFSDLLNYIKEKFNPARERKLTGLPRLIHYENVNSSELSSNQKSLWLLDKIYGNSWFYNISSTHRLGGELNITALRHAIEEIVHNNSALRSFIDSRKLSPVLSIKKKVTHVNFETIDAHEPEEKELLTLISKIQLDPFNLSEYPLYRIRLLRINKKEFILILVFHHLIFDGWSEGLFNKQLEIHYKNYSEPKPSRLLEVNYDYPDFPKWQHQLYQSPLYEKSLNYWAKELDNFTALFFPTTYPRPLKQTHEGSYQYFSFPKKLFTELERLTGNHNTTIFCLLYSAFLILLYQQTGQNDITIGFPISGRVKKEFENIIGNFVSTLPLRSQIQSHMTIAEVIANSHKKIFEGYEHQFVPFQDIVKNITNHRVNSSNPIYQIMLVLQDAPNQTLSLPNLEVDFYKRGYDTARMDFILELNLINNSIDGGIYYNTSLFSQSFIMDLINRYADILQAFSHSKTKNVGELLKINPYPFISENPSLTENSQINYMAVHNKFESYTQKLAKKTAIKFNNASLTYPELNSYANQLANYLGENGVRKYDIVVLHLTRNEDIIICVLACFKLGATYVPLDPEYPTEYKHYIINDCRPKLIVTNVELKNEIYDSIINLSEAKANFIKNFEIPNFNTPINADTPAYIIYTSGTTGKPKGVIISHGSLSNLIFGLQDIYKLSMSDSGLLFHSFSFDFSVWEIWSILAFGGTLVILDNPNAYSTKELWSIISKEKISILNQTPTVFENNLLDTDLNLIKDQIQLRLIIFGGEALYPKRLESWFSVFNEDGPAIYNMYGITETTVHTTYQKIDRHIINENKSLIGTPIPGIKIDLLDEKYQPSKTGEIAEIYVSGCGLSPGYLNRDDLTKKVFITIRGDTWYRSGDFGKKIEGGNIEYIGRNANYAKLRGYRIDPTYVADEIEKHPEIYKSTVWVDENTLMAAIVPDKKFSAPIYNFNRLIKKNLSLSSKRYVLPNGMEILHHNRPETVLQYQEIFVDHEYSKHNIVINENDTVIDVGANIGMFSLFFGAQIKNIKIYAFEPIPELYEILKGNLFIHGISAQCFNCGVSNRKERSDFTYYPAVSVLSGKKPSHTEVESLLISTMNSQGTSDNTARDTLIKAKVAKQTLTCDFIPLSEMIDSQKIDRIHLLKIDVERFELEVLEGIREEQWHLIDQIVVEVHDFDDRLNIITALLISRGFVVNTEKPKILEKSEIWVIYAKKMGLANVPSASMTPLHKWSSTQALEKNIRDFLENKIPRHMIPTKIIITDEISITHNGKIDFEKMKSLYSTKTRSICTDSFDTPNNPIQVTLVNYWKQVLGLESCDLNANFFDVGGDSFLLLKLHNKIAEEVSDTIDILDLFEYTTINQQSNFIELKLNGGNIQ